MFEGRTVAAVVPAHDESQLVRRTIEAIPDVVDAVILVDDGSTDGTAAEARSAERTVDVSFHDANLGVGAAIASGCLDARRRAVDLVVVVAADGQMAPEDLPSLLGPLAAGEADFVKGNRLDWPDARQRMPLSRWTGNHVLSWLTRTILRAPWRDAQCGYVAMNRRTLEAIDWGRLWSGYGYPNDLLAALQRMRLRVCEVPVRPVYRDERSGIRLRHAVFTVPFVLLRAWLRARRPGKMRDPWPTSTSSMVTPMASAPSRSSATPTRETALSSRG